MFEVIYCDYGYGSVENQFYQLGANLLNKCLDLEHLSTDDRATYLQGRAWANFNLGNNKLALVDQQSAFKIRPPTQHFEFINHAAYLRRLELFRESLIALKSAKEIDQARGHPSMLTQYNLGWSLYELNRYEEAIEAFSLGIMQQPDYPFVYLRRGIAYLKQGRETNAREDFSEFLLLVGDQDIIIPADLITEITELPSEYSDIKNL